MTYFNLYLKKLCNLNKKRPTPGMLKLSCSNAGFKKMLYNNVYVQDNAFEPRYNRRKHSLSQDLILNQPVRKLNKMVPGFQKRHLQICVAFSLRHGYGKKNRIRSSELDLKKHMLNARTPTAQFVSMIENHTLNLKTRNMISKTYRHANQVLNHTKVNRTELNVILQKNRNHGHVKYASLKHAWTPRATTLWHA